MTEELLRDRIECGIREDMVRKTLLQKRNLTLSMCIDICRMAEAAATQLKSIAVAESPDVHMVKRLEQQAKTSSYKKERNTESYTYKKEQNQ